MTEQDAIKMAAAFVAKGTFRHPLRLDSARWLPADRNLMRNPRWVVQFDFEFPPDYIETPGCLLIEVDDIAGEVSLIDGLL